MSHVLQQDIIILQWGTYKRRHF